MHFLPFTVHSCVVWSDLKGCLRHFTLFSFSCCDRLFQTAQVPIGCSRAARSVAPSTLQAKQGFQANVGFSFLLLLPPGLSGLVGTLAESPVTKQVWVWGFAGTSYIRHCILNYLPLLSQKLHKTIKLFLRRFLLISILDNQIRPVLIYNDW